MKFAEQIAKRHQVKQGYHSAFITSFSVEFNGFEELVLPQLAAAGSTNIMLIADERMSTIALADGTALPHQLGRHYVLHGPAQTSGVFQAGSSPAPLIHRDILQKQRREVASDAVRRATDKFNSYDEIDLLLLQAFDELDRADGVERELRQRRPSNNDQTTPATEAPPRELSYEEFVKQKPEARNPLGGESSTQRTNIDPVRALLNRLSGGDWDQSEIDPDELPQPPGGSDGENESGDPPNGTSSRSYS